MRTNRGIRYGPLLVALILAVGALGVIATGLVVVAPGEVVVVRRLGRVLPEPWTAGPHLGWPRGIDRHTRVRTDAVRRIEIGRASVADVRDEPGAGEFLTGDRNVLRARAVVQYRVVDPIRATLAGDIEPILTHLAETGLAATLAGVPIDAAMGAGRVEVARETASRIAESADRLRLGIAVLGVSLTDARPPAEVEPDFAAAQSARSGRDQRLIEARAYQATTRTAAEAEARARIDAAEAEATRLADLARARAERFLTLLAEANSSRRLTVGRLYRDALRDLLPRVRRKVLLTPDEPVDLSLFGVPPPR
jgi:membrane protease subunit HflK